ncbi:hypothetical protein KGC94_002525, partial [Enterococcus faecium]|nr:hypothetical protein [Enterococcus faecium]
LSFPFSVLTKADENHSNFNKTEDVIKKTENSLYSEKQNYENENLDKDTDKTAEMLIMKKNMIVMNIEFQTSIIL